MNEYTFRVGTVTKTFTADRAVDAMVLANAHFGSLPQGAWMDHGTNGFRWAEGNFFD